MVRLVSEWTWMGDGAFWGDMDLALWCFVYWPIKKWTAKTFRCGEDTTMIDFLVAICMNMIWYVHICAMVKLHCCLVNKTNRDGHPVINEHWYTQHKEPQCMNIPILIYLSQVPWPYQIVYPHYIPQYPWHIYFISVTCHCSNLSIQMRAKVRCCLWIFDWLRWIDNLDTL